MKPLLCAIALTCFAGIVQSQEPPKVAPATMALVSDAMIEAQLKVAEKPETARRLAVFKKNLLDALIAQGFNRPEAFSIMLATPPPSVSASTK
jgi:hypothetical protein